MKIGDITATLVKKAVVNGKQNNRTKKKYARVGLLNGAASRRRTDMERMTKRLPNGVIHVDFAKQKESVMGRLASIEDTLGEEYDLDELREMVQAKRDGRCVVLPCKIDDDVYINLFGRTLDATVISISELASTPTYKAMYGIRLCYIFKADDVGRTVFLTREAAEEALKAREQE